LPTAPAAPSQTTAAGTSNQSVAALAAVQTPTPSALTTPSASGAKTSTAAGSAPQDVMLTPAASHVQAEVAGICSQLAALGNQLPMVAPLVQQLQILVVRLGSLTQTDPAVASLLARLQGAGESTPSAASLAVRVALLKQLLSHLITSNPASARRLALALPALDALLRELPLRATPGGELPGTQFVANQFVANASGVPATESLAMRAAVGAVFAGGVSIATGHSEPSFSRPMASTAKPPGSNKKAAEATSNSITGLSLLSPVPSREGGGTGSASTGIASGAPAAAGLLVGLIVWLLYALLSGKVEFDLGPPRAALLASRLERPD